jgi:long-chain fatty acid transport protein
MHLSFRRRATGLCALLSVPGSAFAAGYDTPMLYSARHMGMGGVAIGNVDDPSAIFHNPAGLSRVESGAVHIDASPLFGTIHGTPSETSGNIDSNLTKAPFFLAGAGYRLNEKFVFGFSVYPVASAGASYDYVSKDGKTSTTDSTELAFIEAAPSLAVELAPGLRFGAAARFAHVSFQRKVINTEGGKDIPYIDMDMGGWNLAGYRLGMQYTSGHWDFGVVYRNRTNAVVYADKATVTGIPAEKGAFSFILPSKLGMGVHWRATDALRVGLDVEYVANSENQQTAVSGVAFGNKVAVPNFSEWRDSQTFRVGAGYKIGDAEVRVGYALDTQASNKQFPSAFGTPPTYTQIGTVGLGYEISRSLDVSLAAAYRTGSTTVTEEDVKLTQEHPPCQFCGKPGDYAIHLFGAYLDLRWRFGGASAPAKRAPAVEEPKAGAQATPSTPVATEAAPANPATAPAVAPDAQPHA